ncbi:MAG TPA: multiheme c-type cytochrome [candidate division Zixibacteria bacterium]|nr:multiheme c-type cytochrome [candidate division Zixibacteria bacterium]
MRKVTFVAMLFLALLAFTALMVTAQEAAKETGKKEAPAHQYVGPEKCKMCHKAQFTAWEKTPHAKAWEALKADEQKKAECSGCHETGKLEDGTMITSVTCEACHGPGSDYKSPKIMSRSKFKADPEAALKAAKEAGLIIPTADDCMRCHKKEGNPNFKPFDFEKMKGMVHPVAADK